jgi:hypothetical protein
MPATNTKQALRRQASSRERRALPGQASLGNPKTSESLRSFELAHDALDLKILEKALAQRGLRRAT